jgi:hypothetical protein
MRRAAIKWIYLLGLLSFLAWLGNSFAGGYIYARGEGMVIGEPALVAAEFNATIREVLAKQGQVVSKGEVVLHITSQYMAESQARLTSESVQRCDPMLEIVGEHRFVITWFPVGRLFGSLGYDLAVGRRVSVDPGNGSLPGTISKISTVAGALPHEFQKSFAPTERQQFIWIELDKNVTPPPYFTKVKIL